MSDEIDYNELITFWNDPISEESKERWFFYRAIYPEVQGRWGNRLEEIMKGDDGLEARLNRLDGSFIKMIYLIYGRWKYTDYRFFVKHENDFDTYDQKWIEVEEEIYQYLTHIENIEFEIEDEIKELIKKGIGLKKHLSGIGVAGMSGILAMLIPDKYGVVDRYVADLLNALDETNVKRPDDLTMQDAADLEWVLIRKSKELNLNKMGNILWTPREVDKVLWSYKKEKQIKKLILNINS